MATRKKGTVLIAQLESIIQQFESLPALRESVLQDKHCAEQTMQRVITAYLDTADKVKQLHEKLKDSVTTAIKYLDEYHGIGASHPTPAKKARPTQPKGEV